MGDKGYPHAQEFIDFILERERIRLAKEAGHPRSLWTKDPILGTYRFCNVRREDDRVTRWIAKHLRKPYQHCEDLWFLITVARLLNLPESIETALPFILPFQPSKFNAVLDLRRKAGMNTFNAAYIVSTNGNAMDKVEYITSRVLKPLWKDRESLRPTINDDLFGWHAKLMTYDGLGSFMAAQIVADMKYVKPLIRADDWWTFAASGPGSRRGLNRVMGVTPDAPWKRGAWEEALAGLISIVKARLKQQDIKLHAQDYQNCLCEFDKYRRAKEGGRPKQIYKEEKNLCS